MNNADENYKLIFKLRGLAYLYYLYAIIYVYIYIYIYNLPIKFQWTQNLEDGVCNIMSTLIRP